MNINKRYFVILAIVISLSVVLLINSIIFNKRYSVDLTLSGVSELHYLRNDLIYKKYTNKFLVTKFATTSNNRKNLKNAYKEFVSKHTVKCANNEVSFDPYYDVKVFFSVADISSNPENNLNYRFSNECKDFLEKFPEFYIDYINNIMLSEIREVEDNEADVTFLDKQIGINNQYKDRADILKNQISSRISMLEKLLKLYNSLEVEGDIANSQELFMSGLLYRGMDVNDIAFAKLPGSIASTKREMFLLVGLSDDKYLEIVDFKLALLKKKINRISKDTIDIKDQDIISILVKTEPRLHMININIFILALIILITVFLFLFRKKIKFL